MMGKRASAVLAIAFTGCSLTGSSRSCSSSGASPRVLATPIVVSLGTSAQVMDGFGASEAWVDFLTDAQADLFFSTTTGIGLSILRLGIAPSGGLLSENWENARKALARNPSLRIWATPWSPPALAKKSKSPKSGSIDPAAYPSWAATLAGFVATAKANGVIVGAISPQNEPDYDTHGSYEMCLYDRNQLTGFVKVLGPILAALDPPVQLVVPEPSHWANLWSGSDYMGALMADTEAATYVRVVATHQYDAPDPPWHPLPPGKPLWQTESADQGKFDPSIGNAVMIATWIHNAIVDAGVSAWHYWWLIGQNSTNMGLIGRNEDGTLTKRVYAMGNFSRFVRPGWVRVQATGKEDGLLVSAYKDPSGGSFAIVAVNTTGATVSASFRVEGPPFSSVAPYVTSGTPVGGPGTDGNLSLGSPSAGIPPSIGVANNAFAVEVPAGITTFVARTN
jgi:glucuronoarabinoxylan endo-1,4-beta-xylanase